MNKFFSALCLSIGVLSVSYACDKHVETSDYAKATIPGMSMSSAYLTLCNDGATSQILSAISTEQAKHAEIHTMEMQGDKMTMRQLPTLEIAAGECQQLQPGGKHIMLMGLLEPLKVGETLELVLKFEDGSEIIKSIPIKEPLSD